MRIRTEFRVGLDLGPKVVCKLAIERCVSHAQKLTSSIDSRLHLDFYEGKEPERTVSSLRVPAKQGGILAFVARLW